jgi:hypothetical protein
MLYYPYISTFFKVNLRRMIIADLRNTPRVIERILCNLLRYETSIFLGVFFFALKTQFQGEFF